MSEEIWKPIPRFEDKYEASDQGRIKSLAQRRGFILGRERILKPRVNKKGYMRVCLGAKHSKYIHRLVLEAFVGPCPEGMEACHGNGIKADNRLANLRWDTSAANEADSILLGTKPMGSMHRNAKLTEDDVREIRRRLDEGETGISLSKEFGICKQNLSDIKNRVLWKHVN